MVKPKKEDAQKMYFLSYPKRKTPILGELEQEKNTFPEELLGVVKKQHLKILEQFSFDTGDNDSDFDEQKNRNTLETKYFVGVLKQIKKE